MLKYCQYVLLLSLYISCARNQAVNTYHVNEVFSKDNIIPWSIVAFDIKKRSPQARIEMVKELGYRQYAFGGRKEHLATMEEEWMLARKEGIKISAVWLYLLAAHDQPGKLRPMTESVFQALQNTGLHTQIWVGFQPDYFVGLEQKEAMNNAVQMIAYLAQRAENLGCQLALYNHGGWFGEPANQLEIIRRLPKYTMGIIYNFHHGHEHLDQIDTIFQDILPYLWCVNLNGMRTGGPKILTIGEGNLEKEMITTMLDLGYRGPFGIIGHVKGGDPEMILEQNYKGLIHLFSEN